MYGLDGMDALEASRDHRRDDIRWFPIESCPLDAPVLTKIHGAGGATNIDTLTVKVTDGWFYLVTLDRPIVLEKLLYQPTHWREPDMMALRETAFLAIMNASQFMRDMIARSAAPLGFEPTVRGPICFREFNHPGPCNGTPRGVGCPNAHGEDSLAPAWTYARALRLAAVAEVMRAPRAVPHQAGPAEYLGHSRLVRIGNVINAMNTFALECPAASPARMAEVVSKALLQEV